MNERAHGVMIVAWRKVFNVCSCPVLVGIVPGHSVDGILGLEDLSSLLWALPLEVSEGLRKRPFRIHQKHCMSYLGIWFPRRF